MTPLTLAGRAVELSGSAVADRFVIRVNTLPGRSSPEDAALIRDSADLATFKDSALSTALVIGDLPLPPGRFTTAIRLPESFGYLAHGDVVGVHQETRRVRTLYRRGSRHNAFLVTERCNNYCLMCSQPPKEADDSWIFDQLTAMLRLADAETTSIIFTGGEPLLDHQRLMGLLGTAKECLPDTRVHVLTNGRGFANPEIADAWKAVGHPQLSAGIPIYAAVDHIHDYVVQAQGAFDETILGVLRLKDRGGRVEIRVVLHAVTAPHLVATCRWIARNLPFVDHVALMGLENTGFAIANDAVLWIDPVDYRDQLALAVDILACAKVPVSIYNLPYCVLHPSVWPYAAQSISDWKNDYLPECDRCSAKNACAGFFSSGRPKFSRAIEPLGTFALAPS